MDGVCFEADYGLSKSWTRGRKDTLGRLTLIRFLLQIVTGLFVFLSKHRHWSDSLLTSPQIKWRLQSCWESGRHLVIRQYSKHYSHHEGTKKSANLCEFWKSQKFCNSCEATYFWQLKKKSILADIKTSSICTVYKY